LAVTSSPASTRWRPRRVQLAAQVDDLAPGVGGGLLIPVFRLF
jgi:hypothetical protein